VRERCCGRGAYRWPSTGLAGLRRGSMAFVDEVIFRWRAGVAAAGLVALEALLLVAAAADMEREGAARGGACAGRAWRGRAREGGWSRAAAGARDAAGDGLGATAGAGRASRRAARGERRRAREQGIRRLRLLRLWAKLQVASSQRCREDAKRSPA
jgi:hypothetical protein